MAWHKLPNRQRIGKLQRKARILNDLEVATEAHRLYQVEVVNYNRPSDRKLRRYWAVRVCDLRRQLKNLEA
jgi:hypothetical protein